MFGLPLRFVYVFLLSFWGRGSWSLCLSCICLLAMHTLICVTFSLPPSVRGWLRFLLVALPGLFCLPFYTKRRSRDRKTDETEEYLGTMDCHTASVKNERLAMTKCVICITSYLVMFMFENIKLIKDQMMSYLFQYLV